jgi:acetyl esterase
MIFTASWGLLTLALAVDPASAPAASNGAPRPQVITEIAADLQPTRTVVYKKIGDRELRLHLFEPAGWKPTDRRACFVAIHGGGWTSGDARRMYPYADHYAKLGLVGISLEYRLIPKTRMTGPHECAMDGRSALRYLKTHAEELGVDPNKIVVAGGSAGGHVAAGTALFESIDDPQDDKQISPAPAGLVLYYPVIDTSSSGYGNAKCGERWREISPLHQVRKGVPPTIVFHGTGDTVTPYVGARAFDAAMHRAGNRCELVTHEGGVHGYFLYDRALFDDTVRQTDEFLKSLKLLD